MDNNNKELSTKDIRYGLLLRAIVALTPYISILGVITIVAFIVIVST